MYRGYRPLTARQAAAYELCRLGHTCGHISDILELPYGKAVALVRIAERKALNNSLLTDDSVYNIGDLCASHALVNNGMFTRQDVLDAINSDRLPPAVPRQSYNIPIDNLGVTRYRRVLDWVYKKDVGDYRGPDA